MEVRPAGEDGQGFVGAVAAEVRAQVHRVPGGREKAQVRPVGVVRQQGDAAPVGNLRQGGDIALPAQVVRTGDVHRRRRRGELVQGRLQPLRRDGAGAQGGRSLLRPQPGHLQIQQGGGVQERLMDVPRRQNRRTAAGRRVPRRQGQHGPDALGGTLGGVKGPGSAEEGGGVFLALRDDAGRLVEGVRAGDLRDVQGLAAQKGPSFVSRHVQARAAGGGVGPDEVRNGGGHARPAWTAFIIMAHSIRLQNSSQP